MMINIQTNPEFLAKVAVTRFLTFLTWLCDMLHEVGGICDCGLPADPPVVEL